MTEQEKEITDRFDAFIESLEEEMKSTPNEFYYLKNQFAERLAFIAALWGGTTHYEMIGILQEAMLSLREASLDEHE